MFLEEILKFYRTQDEIQVDIKIKQWVIKNIVKSFPDISKLVDDQNLLTSIEEHLMIEENKSKLKI